MSRVIGVSMLFGAVLIVTAALVIHKPEIALAQAEPETVQICDFCVDTNTDSIKDMRAACDLMAQSNGYIVGIFRPRVPSDPAATACAVDCTSATGGVDWVCFGFKN